MASIFDRFKSLKVLIVGDVMIDSYIWGRVDRISPEAPVPIVLVNKREDRLGGAANVALNVQSLGATPIICAVVGADRDAEKFKSILQSKGLSSDYLLTVADRPTTVKTRVIAHNQQIVRIDSESEAIIDADSRKKLSGMIAQLLDMQEVDVVIFEDYDKGLISEELICDVVTLANKQNIITVVDPKKQNFLKYKQVSLFKPNLKEMREGLKIDIDPTDMGSIRDAVAELKRVLSLKSVMLTLSEFGIYISTEKGDRLLPAHIRNIADVSGAGDTVIATAALCLAAGLDLYEAAEISNLAGGLVCESVGVVPIDLSELAREVELLNR